MKLKQIKEFNTETITQDLAAKMCAILGVWSTYNYGDTKLKGFVIKNRWYGVSSPGCSAHGDNWDDPNYTQGSFIRTHHGVEIAPNAKTGHMMRIFPDGHAYCWIISDETSDWENISRCKRDGIEHINHIQKENAYHPIKWLELLLEEGFYTIEHDNINRTTSN